MSCLINRNGITLLSGKPIMVIATSTLSVLKAFSR